MAENTNEDVRHVLIEAAKVQVAALNAGIVFWSHWVEGASKFAQGLNEELLAVARKGSESDQVIGKITDLSREYLRFVTELPNAAVTKFKSDLEKSTEPKSQHSRTARAKE